jgi:hypothetical protein
MCLPRKQISLNGELSSTMDSQWWADAKVHSMYGGQLIVLHNEEALRTSSLHVLTLNHWPGDEKRRERECARAGKSINATKQIDKEA